MCLSSSDAGLLGSTNEYQCMQRKTSWRRTPGHQMGHHELSSAQVEKGELVYKEDAGRKKMNTVPKKSGTKEGRLACTMRKQAYMSRDELNQNPNKSEETARK